jgi:ADP-heptose:LPS heptosyltransferase
MFKTSLGYFNPCTRYIVADFEWEIFTLKKDENTDLHWSSFNSYERRYGGQDLNGKKLIIYRHNAWGDQLIASALAKYIKHRYPDSTIHLYCAVDVMPLWLGNPFVEGSAIPIPIHFDCHDKYDYHLFFEGMLESNSERDQRCCYDDMFAYAGFRDVDPQWKKPCIFDRPEDYRTFNGAKGRGLCDMLRDTFGLDVLVVGLDKEEKYVKLFDETPDQQKRKGPHVRNLINYTPNFRDLIPIVRHARCTVCPDSSVMHLAAAFDAPCVSLWGVFHPNDRVAYYRNHVALTGFSVCPHAPCRDHTFYLPEEQCKDAGNWDKKYCAALGAIPEEKIIEAVKGRMVGG